MARKRAQSAQHAGSVPDAAFRRPDTAALKKQSARVPNSADPSSSARPVPRSGFLYSGWTPSEAESPIPP
jgi:hypothetical protein